MEPFCVVHYDLDIEYSRITELSAKTHKKLLDAKHIRCNSERFGNQHLKQSGSIPCTLDSRIHGIYLECYKKYTQILSKQKVSSGDIDNETISKRPRRSKDEFISSKKTGVILFPKHCFFCKKIRKKHKGKEYIAHKITLNKAEESIKNAARRKNDQEMLLHIDNEDLCSKEFHMHDVCRKDYIRVRTNTRRNKNTTLMQDLEPSKLRSGRLLANDIELESTEVVNIVNDDEEPSNFVEFEHTFNDLPNDNHENNLEIEGKMFDMESVKNEIIQKVFGNGERISIKEIHRLYNDGHQDDRRYRSKLKTKIIEIFGDELRFIQDSHTSPGTICKNVSSCSDGISLFDNDKIINEAAKILRNDILKYSEKNKPDEWPPNLNVLQKSFEDLPKSVNQFLETLLKDPSHSSSERVKRLIKSYSCDLVHGVTSGKVMTLKHYLIGLGFHNLGGQKSIIRLLSQLGHSVSYDTVTTAETALAELNQLQAESCSSSGLQPKTSDGFVYTYFWADNFNKKVESDKVGMIDSKHMIKFQEKNENSCYQEALFRNIKKNRSKFCPNEGVNVGQLVVKPKVNPPNTLLNFDLYESKQEENSFNMRYIIWLFIRHKTSKDALLSNFAGWQLCKRKFEKIDSKKTVTTYLPPINAPVNSFETIYEYLSYMQKICFEANIPYVNVTLDCGAAMNAFKLVWNYPSTFNNIVIHIFI